MEVAKLDRQHAHIKLADQSITAEIAISFCPFGPWLWCTERFNHASHATAHTFNFDRVASFPDSTHNLGMRLHDYHL